MSFHSSHNRFFRFFIPVFVVVAILGALSTVVIYGGIFYLADRALDSVEKVVDHKVVTERAAPIFRERQ